MTAANLVLRFVVHLVYRYHEELFTSKLEICLDILHANN